MISGNVLLLESRLEIFAFAPLSRSPSFRMRRHHRRLPSVPYGRTARHRLHHSKPSRRYRPSADHLPAILSVPWCGRRRVRIETGLQVSLVHDVCPYTTMGLDTVSSHGARGTIQGRAVSLIGRLLRWVGAEFRQVRAHEAEARRNDRSPSRREGGLTPTQRRRAHRKSPVDRKAGGAVS